MRDTSSGLDVDVSGSGPDLVLLHGLDGMLFAEPFAKALAERFTVHVPALPGWSGPRDPRYRSVDDLAYAVLDAIEAIGRPVHLVGCSIGGWLAAETATKTCAGLASVTLVAPLGVRRAEPTERSYLDLYASAPAAVTAAMYGPDGTAPDLSAFSPAQFLRLAEAHEAVAFYAWEPYLHNPALPGRLHRITVPVLLVAGAADGLILRPDHFDLFAAAVGGPCRTEVIPGAGHRVEEQAPQRLAELITEFAAPTTAEDN
ncbi:alpha/beta fold hydrolase [Dactylosporangium sp. CS-033363]|uniref:alpha/beta fold hydrolase n=1 Tax=Dactylosporangium sp. CS-033363 TaxID=3239935 RepID=UPI003D90B388